MRQDPINSKHLRTSWFGCEYVIINPNISPIISLCMCVLHRDAPLSGGNITFALLTPEPNPRPGYSDFYNSPELQRMVQATQVRVLLSGLYHSEAVGMSRGHRYYAISEITISGRYQYHSESSIFPYECKLIYSELY